MAVRMQLQFKESESKILAEGSEDAK
jgi:hypothetical protein